jgi:hypothetical protein
MCNRNPTARKPSNANFAIHQKLEAISYLLFLTYYESRRAILPVAEILISTCNAMSLEDMALAKTCTGSVPRGESNFRAGKMVRKAITGEGVKRGCE